MVKYSPQCPHIRQEGDLTTHLGTCLERASGAGDPSDDYLVALARAGRAHVIVTGDAHLLEADLRPQTVPPREFLARLERLPS